MGTRNTAAPEASVVVNMMVTNSDRAEEFGSILAQVRGLTGDAAKAAKSFKLDLAGLNGLVPEKFDGLAVRIFSDGSDSDGETGTYIVPSHFELVEHKPGAYRDVTRPSNTLAYLASLGIKPAGA